MVIRKLFLAPFLMAAVCSCTPTGYPKGAVAAADTPAIAPDTIRWQLNTLDSIASYKPQLLGQPKVVTAAPGSGTREAAPKAIQFNGTTDALVLPVVPLAGMKAFTLEVLFRPESGGAAEQRFMHAEDSAASRMLLETRLMSGNWALDAFLFTNASNRALYDATKLHPADAWYWVALRYDGTTMSDYVNGIKELEGPLAFTPMKNEGRVSLGVRLNQLYWFKGQIKEVRITPRALPDAELQRIH